MSYRCPSGVTTGFLQGWRVREQQSKPLTASLLIRIFWEPYPEALKRNTLCSTKYNTTRNVSFECLSKSQKCLRTLVS